MHPLLEHADRDAALVRRHGQPGVQPVLVQEHQRARLDARLQPEPDRRVALLVDEQGRDQSRFTRQIPRRNSVLGAPLKRLHRMRVPQVATLTGHTLRVLYLAMSPDGQTIVTGAGDETLRFWNVFPGPKTKGDASDSSSMLDFQGRTAIR